MINVGILQVDFLAGAIGLAIQQHSEEEYDSIYKFMYHPCCFHQKDFSVVNIMWVRFEQFGQRSEIMNHIIPLIPDICMLNIIEYF